MFSDGKVFHHLGIWDGGKDGGPHQMKTGNGGGGEGHTGEHGDFVNIMKGAVPGPLETRPEVRNEDLCAFVKSDGLSLEGAFISETGEMGDDEIDQSGRRAMGLLDAVDEAATKVLTTFTQHMI
jgi:hypothetical protein